MKRAERVKRAARLPVIVVAACLLEGLIATAADRALAIGKPHVVQLDFSLADSEEGSGGVLATDLDGDGQREFVVTAPGHLGAYRLGRPRLWHAKRTMFFSGTRSGSILPGLHAPGVQVADVDGDGAAELVYLDPASTVHILDARSAREDGAVRIPHPKGSERWEAVVVANLRGRGDRDIILQTTNAAGYRVAHHVAAYAVEQLDGSPLWRTERFGAPAHGPLRVADLNGDGRDEVCGFTILAPDGSPTAWRYPPIAGEYAGRIKVGKVNVDNNSDTASKYMIRSIPTLLVFNQGQLQEQIVGAVGKGDITAKLDPLLG